MDSNRYEIAFAEVYEIFNLMDEKNLKKIPEQFKKFIKENKSNEYIPKIDKNIPLHKQELKKETFAICSLIYRNYLVSPEKRKELTEKDRQELYRIEKDLREKYNPDEIFKNEVAENEEQNSEMISSNNENLFYKIIKKICQIFKK